MNPMHDFSNANILVVGDVMLDQYWTGRAGRISPEAPVPVVKVASEEVRAGGAANVALNIVALGATAHLLGIVGKDISGQMDAHGQQLSQLMSQAGVSYDWALVETAVRFVN
jgi:D-beta-D-heptose 7-phosphate kinase/D-beta-D-heptose 1-phosphate adenosyltransferase